jgi:hypothetical protein
MPSNDGVRRLAIAVLTQASEESRHDDAALAEAARQFLTERNADFEHWTTLAGLDSDAVRERLRRKCDA